MKKYTVIQLKSMAFDAARQIHLLREAQDKVLKELVDRGALVAGVELTPDEEKDES